MHAVGYARLSSQDSSSNSIKSQCKRIEDYCAHNNLTLLKLFIDDGRSGWTFDRPGFIELEQFCKANKSVQLLIIPHFDRFSRTDPIDAMVKERYFRDKLGVKVLQVSEPVDTDTNNPTYLIVRFMQAFASNEERNRIVDRVITGMRYSLTQGRYCSSAPVGYRNNRDENNKPLLVIDNDKAPFIRLIFREYLRGHGIEEVRQIVKQKGLTVAGNSGIQKILANPVYAGLVNVPAYKNQPSKIVKGIHTAIITENDFWMANDRLNEKAHTYHRREETPLRGVLKCHCGKLLTTGPSRGKSGRIYFYYFCKEHRKANYNADKLHLQLENIFGALSITGEHSEFLRRTLTDQINDFINKKTKDLMKVNLDIQKLEQSIHSVEEKYLLNNVSATTYQKVIKEKRYAINELQTKQAALNTDAHILLERLNKVLANMTDLRSRWQNFDVNMKQQFFKQVFGPNVIYTQGSVRTPFLHPMFSIEPATALSLGLIIESRKPGEPGLNLSGGAEGNCAEHYLELFMQMAKLFVA